MTKYWENKVLDNEGLAELEDVFGFDNEDIRPVLAYQLIYQSFSLHPQASKINTESKVGSNRHKTKIT